MMRLRAPITARRAPGQHFSRFSPRTVPVGTVLWFARARGKTLELYLGVLLDRGLDLQWVGPDDRYKVIRLPKPKRDPELRRYKVVDAITGEKMVEISAESVSDAKRLVREEYGWRPASVRILPAGLKWKHKIPKHIRAALKKRGLVR